MYTTYAQKQSPAQKKDAPSASSVLDASSQSESLQRKADMANAATQRAEAPRPNNTGMPDNLKSGIESLSGFSMDDVRVHYNSSKPATVQALAYTQGTDIHVAPGQEKHLPHEAWHVAQQMAGRVSPTTNINGMPVNDNAGLEHEADVMGERAVQCKGNEIKETVLKQSGNDCLQRKNVAVVVEMISPKTEINKVCGELESKRKLFKEKVTGKNNCELLFAIDFNSKKDTVFEGDYDNYKKTLEKDIVQNEDDVRSFICNDDFAKNYINAFTEKYAVNSTKTELQEFNCNVGTKDDGYISYGTSSWMFGSSKARCEKALIYELGFSDLPYRGHMPFGAWRSQAHEVAKKHEKANEFKNENYEMIYKTADSDNAWQVNELAMGIEAASADEENHELSICDFFGDVQGDGVEGAASVETEAVLDPSTTKKRKKKKKKKPVEEPFNPLVVTTPYMWTRGNISISDIVENPKYSYEKFLGELNGLEIIKRCRLYKKHPLNIYYPEPTTYFNSDAAECADKRKSGVLEGAAKITAIVRKLHVKQKIKDYSDAAELKKYFKFDADSPLSSDPGNRAKQLLVIYENVKGLKPKERKGKIIEMMGRGLDQSAYEPNYENFVFDWNTKTK